MPEQAWSAKRERQYEHIKSGLKRRGDSEELAEEIAARTVNKERARYGESKTKSRSSTEDISSARRGGLRSHHGAGWSDARPAVPRGEAQRDCGALQDDQGTARASGRSITCRSAEGRATARRNGAQTWRRGQRPWQPPALLQPLGPGGCVQL